MRTYISWLPLTLPLSPTETHAFCPFSRISGVGKGRVKETAVAQAAQSAASEVGTRGLLFASSEGFIALMSARWSRRPGKWPCLLMSVSHSSRSNSSSPATFTSTWFLSKLHEGLKAMLPLKCAPPNPVGQQWGRALCFIYVQQSWGSVLLLFFFSFFDASKTSKPEKEKKLENNFLIKSK